ncbi:MAG: DUF433 domain-containing protein [Verrucomicrobiota bacterium]
MTQFPRITRDPAVTTGRACIRDSRIAVSTLLALLAVGRSHEEILRMFPLLTPEDLRETLAYAAWWIDEQTPPVPSAPPPEVKPHAPALPQPIREEQPAESSSIPIAEEPAAAPQAASEDLPATEEALDTGDREEASDEEEEEVEETLELFHPDHPDQPTVVVTRHGIYDQRWGTHTIAWCDIREMQRKSSKKTIEIVLRNPEFYITSMPFFKRLRAQIKLALNIDSLRLDTASLGIRTRDLYHAANRLWISHRGRMRFRKKRRMRVDGTRDDEQRPVEWDRYQPM